MNSQKKILLVTLIQKTRNYFMGVLCPNCSGDFTKPKVNGSCIVCYCFEISTKCM